MNKICVITSTRAEYGLLSSVIRIINDDISSELLLIATGMHLDVNYGETYREIEEDGFIIDYKIPIDEGDSEADILKTIANGIIRVGEVLRIERPDIVVILGDRYELLSFASAAVVLRIPIAHISGGEITSGSIDEYIRHAITKMSVLHFVSTEEYKNRVIQMGEQPRNVYNVGDLGVANIKNLKHMTKSEVEEKIGMKIDNKLVQVTYHPETLSSNSIGQFKNLLFVLNQKNDLQIVFTKSNADLGGRTINALIDDFVKKNEARSSAFFSLGRTLFLNLLSYSVGIVGNSSSGIVEAPSLKVGTVNIGKRQDGRTRASSIIDCDNSIQSIDNALNILFSRQYNKNLITVKNPYESDNTAEKILFYLKMYLKSYNNDSKKKFFDLERK